MAEKIVEGKRKKMLQEARKKRKTDDDSDPIAEFEPEPVVDKELVINQEIASIKPITRYKLTQFCFCFFSTSSYIIQGHASHTNSHGGALDG